MSTNSSGSVQLSSTGTAVHSNRLADDETIADEFADGLSGVGVGDFVDFVRVEPDFAFAASDHGGRKALLGTEIDPMEENEIVSDSIALSKRACLRVGIFFFSI